MLPHSFVAFSCETPVLPLSDTPDRSGLLPQPLPPKLPWRQPYPELLELTIPDHMRLNRWPLPAPRRLRG